MSSRQRFHLIDEIRGFVVILLIFFHAFYDMYMLGWPMGQTLYDFFRPAEPFFAGVFIFLCGLCCQLSRNNLKRGLILLAIALAITAGSLFLLPDEPIYFGILSCLSVSILLCHFLRWFLSRIPPAVGCFLFGLLFLICLPIREGAVGIGPLTFDLPSVLYTSNRWVVFGFFSPSFASADYFPLLPWVFLFLAGNSFGLYAARNRLPAFFKTSRAPWLSWMGRRTLLIYLIHQPILLGIFYGMDWLLQSML